MAQVYSYYGYQTDLIIALSGLAISFFIALVYHTQSFILLATNFPFKLFQKLKGMASYADQLLVPAEGFNLWPKAFFFFLLANKKGPFKAAFCLCSAVKQMGLSIVDLSCN